MTRSPRFPKQKVVAYAESERWGGIWCWWHKPFWSFMVDFLWFTPRITYQVMTHQTDQISSPTIIGGGGSFFHSFFFQWSGYLSSFKWRRMSWNRDEGLALKSNCSIRPVSQADHSNKSVPWNCWLLESIPTYQNKEVGLVASVVS